MRRRVKGKSELDFRGYLNENQREGGMGSEVQCERNSITDRVGIQMALCRT